MAKNHPFRHIRANFTLNPLANRILNMAHKTSGIDKSKIISRLIIKNLQDELEYLCGQKKELMQKVNAINDRIMDIEEDRKEKKDKNVSLEGIERIETRAVRIIREE